MPSCARLTVVKRRSASGDASTDSEDLHMEWLDVLRRIEAGEGSRTEFKRGLGDLSDIGKAICAFGNGDGGLIILGVDNAGVIVGVREDPERVQERLTSFLQSGCSVPVSARCGKDEDPNGWVHWIDVPRQARQFEPLHYDGRFWIRRERSSVPPSPAERQALFNDFGFVLTEEQVIRAATTEDIDHDAFRSFLRAQGLDTDEEPQPPLEEDMRNAGLLAMSDGNLHPTLYGVMVFGRDPQNHPQTSNFFIQCAAYAGLDRATDVVSVADARGRLVDQINRAHGMVQDSRKKRNLSWNLAPRRSAHSRQRASRGPRQCRHSLRICNHGIVGAVRNIQRPDRRDQSRNPSQSHGGGERARREPSAFSKRIDGARHGRRQGDGAAGTRLAPDAAHHARIQWHGTGYHQ